MIGCSVWNQHLCLNTPIPDVGRGKQLGCPPPSFSVCLTRTFIPKVRQKPVAEASDGFNSYLLHCLYHYEDLKTVVCDCCCQKSPKCFFLLFLLERGACSDSLLPFSCSRLMSIVYYAVGTGSSDSHIRSEVQQQSPRCTYVSQTRPTNSIRIVRMQVKSSASVD